MKGRFLLFGFLVISSLALAQANVDSIERKPASEAEKININSVGRGLTQYGDSLSTTKQRQSYQNIDSIRLNFNHTADSIKTQYQNALSAIDAQAHKVQNGMDSVQRLRLVEGKYTRSLDSLNELRARTESQFSSRLNALKAKTIGKLQALDVPAEYKGPLQQLTKSLSDVNMHSDVMKISELNISGLSLPKIEDVGDLTAKAGELAYVGKNFNLQKIETPAGDLGQVRQHATGLKEDLKNLAQGNFNDVKALPETIEDQAAKIDGMQELQKQSGIIQGYKSQLDELKEPDGAKTKAVALAKKAATDHFAGKQEQLKAAMEKISKYKEKYPSASSIKDLPKRRPNAMKGKPLIERLTPGLYFQYQQKGFYLFDVNPYVGYKISGRFTAGLGWNHRYTYDKDNRSFTSWSRIYGPRGYLDSKLGKGFIAHLEGEAMNAFVPSTLIGNADTGQREWVWSFMTGLKKEYKIYKDLKGTALIQYNWFNRYYKAPYVDRLNSRIGFEYTIKKQSERRVDK